MWWLAKRGNLWTSFWREPYPRPTNWLESQSRGGWDAATYPELSSAPVITGFAAAVMKHCEPKRVGEEMVYLACTSWVAVHSGKPRQELKRDEKLDQELTQRPWRRAAYWLAPPGLLSLLSYRIQGLQTRDGTTHHGLGPPPLVTN